MESFGFDDHDEDFEDDDESEKSRKALAKLFYRIAFVLCLALVYIFYGQGIRAWGEQTWIELKKTVELYTADPEVIVIPPAVEESTATPRATDQATVNIELLPPFTHERHVENCVTDNFKSRDSVETENTKILGMSGYDFEHYTLYINMSGGANYAVEFNAKTGYFIFTVLEGNVSTPVYSNFWEYDFRGETFVSDLPNGDVIFLYIPWPDGYPNRYLYYVASSVEEGCGL